MKGSYVVGVSRPYKCSNGTFSQTEQKVVGRKGDSRGRKIENRSLLLL